VTTIRRELISEVLSVALFEKRHHCFVSFAGAVVFCLLLISRTVQAQSPSLVVGSVTGAPGASVDLQVSFTAGATAVSGLQFDLSLPAGVSYVSVTTGSAATAAGKNAQASAVSGGVRVLVFGLNQTPIALGPLAVIRLSITTGTAAGTWPVGITNIVASDPGGTAVLSNGTNGSVIVTGPPDATPPMIKFTQIILSNVSNTSITINWSTDKATTGLIEYGRSTVNELNNYEPVLLTNHVTRLAGLTPSTVYLYRITVTDSSTSQATSSILRFKTADSIGQPARPSLTASFISQVVENTDFRTNLGINNLSTSLANVSVTLVDIQGMVMATKTMQVEPKGLKQINTVARYLYDENFGNDIRGNLYLESDQPITAWASQIDNATNDPSLLASQQSGTTKILIPSAANTSTFRSSLVLMNAGANTASVAIKAYGVDGAVLGQTATALSLAPNGILSFDNVLQTLGISDNYGPIEITSLNNIPLVAASRVSSTSNVGGFFEGVKYSDASLVQIIPHVVDTPALRTNIGINNVSDNLATVVVKLINQEGVELGTTVVTVLPKGLTQINQVVRQLLNRDGLTDLEGYIRLESSQPIVGWASQIDNVTNDPGFSVSKGLGASKLLVQSTANVGSFKSSLVVVNPGNSTATVDIVARDIEGKVQGEMRSRIIPPGGFISFANVLQSLGTLDNFGPVEIISTNGQRLLATSRVYSISGTSGFFEAQAIE
jgi:chitodextrinase